MSSIIVPAYILLYVVEAPVKANSHVDWVLHKSSIDSALRRKKKRREIKVEIRD